VGGAAEEIRLALHGVREGRSLVHDVLYEEKSSEMVAHLNQATADLSAIVADVRAGKGTLGSFLVDPSVYEDVKVLLGNVGRNRSLKALVRYSIKQDEAQNRVIDTEASAPASAPVLANESVEAEAGARLE
jgi:phospholipid/cholesterol/gamma-HCH transport system substrate-binding protein